MVLLSVRPRFAASLLDGTKTVEVRRRRVRVPDGAVCLLYASSPMRALVGAITVSTTESASAEDLWSRHGHAMGLDRKEYDEYLEGAANPCAIIVGTATAFGAAIQL